MFYSDNILARKGPLANIWLAAHWDRRLTKAQIVQTDIEHSVRDMVSGTLPPMALRLSGQLLLGVSKIYSRKARYLLEDCTDALTRLKVAFRKGNVDLPASASKASHSTITIPPVTNLEDALAPEPELDLEYARRPIVVHYYLATHPLIIHRALLRETAIAPSSTIVPTHQHTAAAGARRDLGELEMGRAEINLPPAHDKDLQDILMGVNFGRDSMLGAISPMRQSIEVGRREESPRPSLPFSPLRGTPTKGSTTRGPESAIEQVPLDDDRYDTLMMVDDELPMMPITTAPEAAQLAVPRSEEDMKSESDIPAAGRFSGPPETAQPALTRQRRRPAPTHSHRSGRRPVPLDEETEIPNVHIQEQVRNPKDTLLATPSWADHLLAQALQVLQLTEIALPSRGRSAVRPDDELWEGGEAAAVEEQVPLDDYMLGPEDYAMDAPLPHSPKSPRLLSPHHHDDDAGMVAGEGAVPELASRPQDRPSSVIPPSPTKSSRSRADSTASAPLEGLGHGDALARWQSVFPATGSPSITLSKLASAIGRRSQVAQLFHELLVLGAKDMVKAEQLVPFGDIKLRPTAALFAADSVSFS